MKTIVHFILLSFTLVLIGCGFHFTNKQAALDSLPPLNIESQLPSIWQQRLYRFMKLKEITNHPSSKTTLKIIDFEENRRPVSLNSRAKVAEYRLELSFVIELLDEHNTALMPAKKLSEQRIYRFNEQQVPGKQAEEDFLQQSMIEDLFDQMIRYVHTALILNPQTPK